MIRQRNSSQRVIIIATIARLIGILFLASKAFANHHYQSHTTTARHPSNTVNMFHLGFIQSNHPTALHRSMLSILHPTRNPVSKNARSANPSRQKHASRLFATNPPRPPIQSVAIVGGGLAGLSTACALLSKTQSSGRVPRITIIDKEGPGCGGASAVAGGYVLCSPVIVLYYTS